MTEIVLDAKNKKLGRLASEIASILMGKDSANYEPRLEGDNKVIVKNISALEISGKKSEQKVYYHHTGYMGHLREKSYEEIFNGNPAWILKHAVAGMLPKNKLQDRRLNRLVIEG